MIEPRITLSVQLVDGAPPVIVSYPLEPADVRQIVGKPGVDYARDERLDIILSVLKVKVRRQLEARKDGNS